MGINRAKAPALPPSSSTVDVKEWRRENLTRWERVKTALGFRTRLPEGMFWRG